MTKKYIKIFKEHFKTVPVFTTRDVRLFLNQFGSKNYALRFIQNLKKSNALIELKNGFYTLIDDITVSGFMFDPFYYGLGKALTYYNCWDYVTPMVIITIRNVRSGIRMIMGMNVDVKRINKKMFFGFRYVPYENMFYIPMATLEKTLIDLAYFNIGLGDPQIYKNILEKIDHDELKKLMKQTPLRIKKRVENIIKNYSSRA